MWNQSHKDEFIDTALLQHPAPAIFLYEEVSQDGVSIYQVVDGKQRLTAVFEFCTGVYPVSEESPLTQLRGMNFEQFSREEKTAFGTYQFPIEYLPTNDETIINTIFHQINKNTARLSRQRSDMHALAGNSFQSQRNSQSIDRVPLSVSLGQLTFASLFKAGSISTSLKNHWPLVTPELEDLYPSLRSFSPRFDYS